MKSGLRHSRARGISLVEMLVALALVSAILAVGLAAVGQGVRLSLVQPEVADLDQRLRVATLAVRTALELAGAGLPAGENPGALTQRWPAVYPHRRGSEGADPPDAAFTDRFTVVWASPAGVAPGLSAGMLALTSSIGFLLGPPCSPSDVRCGFRTGQLAAVDDRLGSVDIFRVASIAAGVMGHSPAALSKAYSPAEGARVLPLEGRHFRFDPARRQLRVGTGGLTESPLLDDVVAFEVAYEGTSRPPSAPRPPPGVATCLYDEQGDARLPVLGGAVGERVTLPADMLADGPFCGEGAGRYDADLLRVRRVIVRLTVSGPGRRGPNGPRTELDHLTESREVLIDVVPRNLERAS